MDIKKAANYLQTALLNSGIIIHRYDAYSTCSTYLKLDWGALNSIRISDHSGYDHLSYKYNVNSNYKGSKGIWKKDGKGFWKYYIGADKNSLDSLISTILKDRFHKNTFYNYSELIEKCKQDSKTSKGFWEKAQEVVLNTGIEEEK